MSETKIDNIKVSTIYSLAIDLAIKDQMDMPIKEVWNRKLPNNLTFAINPKKETQYVRANDDAMEVELKLGQMAIWEGDWLLGLIFPDGGVILGDQKKEEEVIEAFKQELEK
jgi:hypothetical protein